MHALKNRFNYLILLIFSLIVSEGIGQHAPYILGDHPAVSSIERCLQLDEIDSVFILSDIVLNNNISPTINGATYYYKGLAEEAMRLYELADKSYDRAIKLFTADDYKKGLALAFAKKGDVSSYHKDYDKAQVHYDRAIQYSTDLNLYGVLIDVFQKKAYNDNAIQSPTTAIQNLERALHYSLQAEDDNQSNIIINQISTNYHSLGELDSAIHYFQKGIQIKKEMDDPSGLISDYSALGNLFRERGEYKRASTLR